MSRNAHLFGRCFTDGARAFLLRVALLFGLCLASPANPQSAVPGRSRIVIVHDPAATDAFKPRPEVISKMVAHAITSLTGKSNAAAAWGSLVSTQETIGIKVYSSPGPNSGTRAAVAAAVVEGLLASGMPPSRIVIWDKHRGDLRRGGFFELAERYGVRVEGSAQAGYDESIFYETPFLGHLVWGDFQFGKTGEGVGRKSYVSKLLTKEITKIINITPLLNHNSASVCGNLFSLAMGSVDNTIRFETDMGRAAEAVPEIYALRELGDRVVLNITDALVCQYQGEQKTLLHYSTVLNELRVSRDPVALDVLSIQELERQRKAAGAATTRINRELYENGALLELGAADPDQITIERVK